MSTSAWAEVGVGEALTRLAVARGGLLDDITSEVYLDRLERFSPELVARACQQWADIPRRDYETTLPSVGQLIATIEELARADRADEAARRLLPLPKRHEDEPTYFCYDCRDEPGAWRLYWCQGAHDLRVMEKPDRAVGLTIADCGRLKRHEPHSFADKCACEPHNPVIAEHRRRMEASKLKKKALP